MFSKHRPRDFSSLGSATIVSSVGSTSNGRARGSLRVITRTRNPCAHARSAMERPTNPVPPTRQTLSISMSGNVRGDGGLAPASRHGAQKLAHARRLAGEAMAVEPCVREHLLHVVARLGEGNGLDVDRALEGTLVAPAARAARPGVVRGGGEDRMAEVVQH